MARLSKQKILQIAEIANAQSFVIVCVDSALPCGDEDCRGHQHSYHQYNMDDEHAVIMLETAVERLIRNGLRGQS